MRRDIKTATQLLREAALVREFQPAPEDSELHECLMCFAVVTKRSRQSHMDWHDEVYRNLVELQKLLGGSDD